MLRVINDNRHGLRDTAAGLGRLHRDEYGSNPGRLLLRQSNRQLGRVYPPGLRLRLAEENYRVGYKSLPGHTQRCRFALRHYGRGDTAQARRWIIQMFGLRPVHRKRKRVIAMVGGVHDLAIADIATTLGERAANVHFEDQITDGQIRFDYVMRPGVVRKSNAIELMRSVGLEI